MNGREELIDSLSEDAQREFERLKALVQERGDNPLAEPLLVLLVTDLEFAFQAADTVREKGIAYVAGEGQLYERPEMSMLIEAVDGVRKMAETLGVAIDASPSMSAI